MGRHGFQPRGMINPMVAFRRPVGPQPDKIKDFLNRPRPTWDQIHDIIKKKEEKHILEHYEEQSDAFRAELDRNRADRLDNPNQGKAKEGGKEAKKKHHHKHHHKHHKHHHHKEESSSSAEEGEKDEKKTEDEDGSEGSGSSSEDGEGKEESDASASAASSDEEEKKKKHHKHGKHGKHKKERMASPMRLSAFFGKDEEEDAPEEEPKRPPTATPPPPPLVPSPPFQVATVPRPMLSPMALSSPFPTLSTSTAGAGAGGLGILALPQWPVQPLGSAQREEPQ
ncbi:hypothetical protein PAPYR_4295 [Paratrimastix pyriformis]|uniref:Uncharacterized protein n=1 Tax=Paratrimastix pyriformis TaxID=342808 RepID=A0ABQ8UMQ1_9EUKA|nr:hypothetical protein PAPYR_4295 [Paratrimastix pyriformis]